MTTAMSLSLGTRMRRGLRNFCHGDSSTSTGRNNPLLLHRQQRLFLVNNCSTVVNDHHGLLHHDGYDGSDDDDDDEDEGMPFYNRNGQTRHRPPSPVGAPTPTLEEMIKQLELEEEMAAVASARKAVAINLSSTRRTSCVNTTSDRVLRSARNALNQYPPRFSLDGKDSMYRSSFLHNDDDRRGRMSSACCCDVAGRSRRLASLVNDGNSNVYRYDQKNVVWCRPGVVPKLMGLDAIPIPRDRFFAVYNKKAPVVLRKRRYGGGDEDIQRGIRPPEMRRSGNR
ncbi:hypothetical protein LINGRAHAP2_LOCUS16017 [Linum grandiflorum]